MGRFAVLMAVCLLVGLSDCEGNPELTQEDPENNLVENDAFQTLSQGVETPATVTPTQPSCEPPIYAVLKELGALQERLAATVKALEETNRKLEASDKKLSEFNRSMTELTTKDEATVKALEETNRKLEASDKKLSELNSTVTELTTKDEGQPRVAFSAGMPVDGTIGPVNAYYHLVYRRVLSNIGGHYSPVTGYFTAPVPGVYYFTFTSFCWRWDGICGGSLYQNENRKVSWYDDHPKSHSSRSNSAILQLQVGDKVNVRLWDNARISDNGALYSTFSGFLLFPL